MEVGEARVQLHSGDLLVLTTDGIHEARDAQGNAYGIKRLVAAHPLGTRRADDVVKAILQMWTATWPRSQGDDITIVAGRGGQAGQAAHRPIPVWLRRAAAARGRGRPQPDSPPDA